MDQVRNRAGTTIDFSYTTFDGTTERQVGADGAIILSVSSHVGTYRKAVLFQAKRLPGREPRTKLQIRVKKERDRFARQLQDIHEVGGRAGAVGLFFTRRGIFVTDAELLATLAQADPESLKTPLVRRHYPLTLHECIAELALVCHVGSTSKTLLRELQRDGLKSYAKRRSLRHRLDIAVKVKKRSRNREQADDEGLPQGIGIPDILYPPETAESVDPEEPVGPKALPEPGQAYREYLGLHPDQDDQGDDGLDALLRQRK